MQSSYSQDDRVIKYRPITQTNLQGNNISLHIVGDMYLRTRTQNTFATLIMPIENFDHPSYWYNLSRYNDGSLCKLHFLEFFFSSMLEKCRLISRKSVRVKRKNNYLKGFMVFIYFRIRIK